MASGQVDSVFVGRAAELNRIADVRSMVRRGRPWLVSIEGEAGIGKTALATRAVAPFARSSVLRARGDASESDLHYGVVQQLVRAVDPELVSRHPLLAGDMSTASPFAVGAELLGLVGAQHDGGPVAMILDDVQWADGRSVEALSFVFRRLSVDPVLVIVVVRGDREHLDDLTRRMLLSMPERLHLRLAGLRLDDVASLAWTLGAAAVDDDTVRRLYDRTGGHTLYVRTVLTDPESLARHEWEHAVPRSLTAAIGDQLAVLPTASRAMLEMLAVLNCRVPLARLGEAAQVPSASAALEPAVTAGLVDWWPQEPTCPVAIHHVLQRDAIYGQLSAGRRRELHATAVSFIDEREAWTHRVASLEGPDEKLAFQLERLAAEEEAGGQLSLASTHLLWASDISPDRADRERRMLSAALLLILGGEPRAAELRAAAESSAPSALRSCVLGGMALVNGHVAEARMLLTASFAEARRDPSDRRLAAMSALRLAGTHILLGDGDKVQSFARVALETGGLSPVAEGQARALLANGVYITAGPEQAVAVLAYAGADPTRVQAVDVDALSHRGIFHLLAGDLHQAVADLTSSLKLVRKGAHLTLGLHAYGYLTLAQYFSGAWDDALVTSEQGLSAATIGPTPYDLPLLHLAATCVPAGRGAMADAEYHARRAEQAEADFNYGQEQLFGAMARALVGQAAGDYQGVLDALAHWSDDEPVDRRGRRSAVIWGPLMIEGLIGCGWHQQATVALDRLATRGRSVAFLQPAFAWLEGWLAEEQGRPEAARRMYEDGEKATGAYSPLYRARLLLAFGRFLRRTGQRRSAIERLREANALFQEFGAEPWIHQTEDELAACGLQPGPARRRSALEMTNREHEVAHLVHQRLTNAEIAAELFITPKAVEYHLSNIYAKLGLKGRQQLRRFLDEARQPSLA